MKKTSVIQSMITGMGVGFPVTLTCMAAIGGFNPVIREFLTWAVASALCGLVSYLLFRSRRICRYSLWCIWWFWAFFMAAPNGRRKK